jgi:hypothetical protein
VDEQVCCEILLSKTAAASKKGELEHFKTSSIFDLTSKKPELMDEESERVQRLKSS